MKTKLAVITAMGLGLVSGAAMAAGVTGTPHDFSAATWQTEKELCLPCHVPHGSLDLEGFLWSHAIPADSSFTKWAGATLAEESLSCLGCHDGQTSLDAYAGNAGTPGLVMTGDANLTTDLRDDHPVGVDYPLTSTRYNTTISTVFGGPGILVTFGTAPSTLRVQLPLAGDFTAPTVECTTCHTPHDNSRGAFLRVKNNDPIQPSALCVACHTAQK